MVKLFYRFLLIASSFFFVNCFDYEETITFKKDYSGTIEIAYSVPLKEDRSTSLIRFLPTQKSLIQTKIDQVVGSSSHPIHDYQFRILEKGEYEEHYFDTKGKVSYKIDFKEISELERILPGNLISKFKGKSLILKREFPSFSGKFLDEASLGEKKIINETSKLLKEGKMTFRIYFPSNTECYSNKGTINLGSMTFVYPLTDSMESQNTSRLWEVKLRIF